MNQTTAGSSSATTIRRPCKVTPSPERESPEPEPRSPARRSSLPQAANGTAPFRTAGVEADGAVGAQGDELTHAGDGAPYRCPSRPRRRQTDARAARAGLDRLEQAPPHFNRDAVG